MNRAITIDGVFAPVSCVTSTTDTSGCDMVTIGIPMRAGEGEFAFWSRLTVECQRRLAACERARAVTARVKAETWFDRQSKQTYQVDVQALDAESLRAWMKTAVAQQLIQHFVSQAVA
jgi:hypothetical protein